VTGRGKGTESYGIYSVSYRNTKRLKVAHYLAKKLDKSGVLQSKANSLGNRSGGITLTRSIAGKHKSKMDSPERKRGAGGRRNTEGKSGNVIVPISRKNPCADIPLSSKPLSTIKGESGSNEGGDTRSRRGGVKRRIQKPRREWQQKEGVPTRRIDAFQKKRSAT